MGGFNGASSGAASVTQAAAKPEERLTIMQDAHPVAERIRDTLEAALTPSALDVVDESHKHAKHAHMMGRSGAAGAPSETHFRIKVVSESFRGKSLLERHRAINDLVAGEMGPEKVHAIAIEAKVPGE